MTNKELFRKKCKSDELHEFMNAMMQDGVTVENLQFLCIGTDRSTGDAVGPLVGSLLEEAGYDHVIGTLAYPCDSSNLAERIAEIDPHRKVLAIDACLGHPSSVWHFQVANQSLVPGKSLGKGLPAVGDYSIAAIVGIDGPKPYAVLQTTSLHRSMQMAKEIANAIMVAYPVRSKDVSPR